MSESLGHGVILTPRDSHDVPRKGHPLMTDADAWARLGALLVRRRVELDRRYRNRQLFATERDIEYRLVSDIERHRRQNFEETTIAVIEAAYDLAPGSIGRVLAGGDLASPQAVTSQDPGPAQDSDPYGVQLAQIRDELAALLDDIDKRIEALPPQANGGQREAS
jgi:hypothetical protein